MEIIILGLNHKSAPLGIREKVAFPEQEIGEPLRAIRDLPGVQEGLILSTCNRVEVLVLVDDREEGTREVKGFLSRYHQVEAAELEPHLYLYRGGEAVRHLFRVAASLDSMVVGEPQILGQVKDAYQWAREAGSMGLVLDRLLKKTLSVAKKVRTETEIAKSAVSISYAAVELARKIFGDTGDRTVMIIGAGEMGELALRHLITGGVREILVTNRTFEKAVELARKFEGSAVKFEDLSDHLVLTDIVISSTGAPHLIIRAEDVRRIMSRRKYQPIFFIDIAVPRDIDPAVNEVDNAYLYNIDDLQAVVDANLQERSKEAEKAEAMVEKEVGTFQKWVHSLQVVPTIISLRQAMEKIRRAETDKVLGKLLHLPERDREQVKSLSHAIINKVLHRPQTVLKEASHTGESGYYLEVTRRIFDLVETEGEGEDRDRDER